MRERIEVEVEQSFAVAVADGAGHEVAEEALTTGRERATASKQSEWSQLVANLCVSLEDIAGRYCWRGPRPVREGRPRVLNVLASGSSTSRWRSSLTPALGDLRQISRSQSPDRYSLSDGCSQMPVI